MNAWMVAAMLLAAGPAPSSEYQYGAGAVDIPALTATPRLLEFCGCL